jgi:uncharacterized protein YjiS (DUF1127 family)
MTAHHYATGIMHAGARKTLVARWATAFASLYRNWKNRRDFYRLGELSDTELADIGLTRSDLHVAMDGPFGSDPTVRLRSLASARLDGIEDIARRVA